MGAACSSLDWHKLRHGRAMPSACASLLGPAPPRCHLALPLVPPPPRCCSPSACRASRAGSRRAPTSCTRTTAWYRSPTLSPLGCTQAHLGQQVSRVAAACSSVTGNRQLPSHSLHGKLACISVVTSVQPASVLGTPAGAASALPCPARPPCRRRPRQQGCLRGCRVPGSPVPCHDVVHAGIPCTRMPHRGS